MRFVCVYNYPSRSGGRDSTIQSRIGNRMKPNFTPADRIAHMGAYYFVTLAEQIRLLKEGGTDIIRLDIGSPDLPPTPEIIDALYESAKRPNTHGYSEKAGSTSFRQAIVEYYQRRFQVTLDPNREVAALIGSKEGLFHLAQAFLNPGDLVLVPDPGYPVYQSASQIAGASIFRVPLKEENQYLVDFSAIPTEIAQQAKLLWLNYPNNPTGAIADLAFFEKAVDFALQHNVLIAHDAPYTEVCFEDYQAPSLLQIPEARDCAVEFNSLSKTYNMAGWRLGFALGNQQALQFLNIYKSQLDSSHFKAVLEAGAAALNGDQAWINDRNRVYQQRRDLIMPSLERCGIAAQAPKSTLYIWCHIPEKFASSEEFTQACLKETGVSFAPGNIYGNYGEGYFRISMVIPAEHIQEAMRRLEAWLHA